MCRAGSVCMFGWPRKRDVMKRHTLDCLLDHSYCSCVLYVSSFCCNKVKLPCEDTSKNIKNRNKRDDYPYRTVQKHIYNTVISSPLMWQKCWSIALSTFSKIQKFFIKPALGQKGTNPTVKLTQKLFVIWTNNELK